MRQITIVIGIIIFIGSIFGAQKIISNKKSYKTKENKLIPLAYVKTITNNSIPISIREQGRLLAKKRMNLFAEVQGIMEVRPKDFKPGISFKKGEIMIEMKNDAYYANLQAQKSILQNLITSVLPDLRLDYPDAYLKWVNYLNNFQINQPLKKLPESTSDQEKFFITGKNIYTTFYNTKNLELIYQKHLIKAPFDGILTSAQVDPGTVIRTGQLLGEFIDPTEYEMQVDVSKNTIKSIKVGEQVQAYTTDNETIIYSGVIARINGKIDQETQTVKVFILLKASDLKEGMFLEAVIPIQNIENAFEVNRSLLVNQNKLFIVQDSILTLLAIKILHKGEKNVVVDGLSNGMLMIDRIIPNAYQGMKVAPIQVK